VGPLLLMVGLMRTDAATASLLLTLEAAVTALMAPRCAGHGVPYRRCCHPSWSGARP
jgi:hypothetical protein